MPQMAKDVFMARFMRPGGRRRQVRQGPTVPFL
jgi:hypothetical protein